MFKLGAYNTLIIHRFTSVGAYLGELDAEHEDVILLPNKYLKPGMKEGTEVEVFVYLDSQERPVATTLKPYILPGEFKELEVKQVARVGAFLDWGLEKDLFVPYGEMVERMFVGEKYLVGVYLDEHSNRLVATPRIGRLLDQENLTIYQGEEVDMKVYNETELGFQVIINGKHGGLIYENEVDRDIEIGDELKGFIKQIRPDGKIDVSLQPLGVASIEPNAQKILDVLNASGGTLGLSDKSSPEEITAKLGMSKKLFKKAIGSLYKKRLIAIEDFGIRALVQNYTPQGPKHLRDKK
ncbi:MAG: GntR family transcriptional regulator [Flavobacteriales bacterium]|nr:GntR family transcriptional regulator [Flavobacteriales bacterium]MCB9190499.1 GntR family transcriptional regulator [Flavobacteriales bacterium]